MLSGEELLFIKNNIYEKRTPYIIGNDIHVRIKKYNGFINGTSITRLISDLKYILEFKENKDFKIVLDFDKAEFQDKLVYILCECICSILIELYGITVLINITKKTNIITHGLEYTCMKYINKTQDYSGFIKHFHNTVAHTHYRRIIDVKYAKLKNYLGNIMAEIADFLNDIGINSDAADELSEVVSELTGNVFDHAVKTDCLIDIDVALHFINKKDNIECYGINVIVLNFSNELLGNGIKRKLSNKNFINGRYETVANAYKKHSMSFDNTYDADDFYNIMAFQDHISGRKENSPLGGAGLTCLINSLCEKSYADNCYVLSGNKGILFNKEYLKHNSDNWLGFNASNDIFDLPDKNFIMRSKTYFCGVAYNLNFIINKKE